MGFVRQVTDKDPKAQIEPFENGLVFATSQL